MTQALLRLILALVLAAPAGACGGRTIGALPVGDAGPGEDTGPGEDAGPGPDAGPLPDAGPGRWVVPAEPEIIYNETEPGFVMSLDRMGDRGYVLGGASGWQDLQAGLWVLDPETLAPLDHTRVSAEMVWARYDPWRDAVIAVAEDNNQVTLRRFQIDPTGGLVERDTMPVCIDCVTTSSSPVVSEAGAAVAVRHLTGEVSMVQAFVWPAGSVAVVAANAVTGDTPHLLPVTEGPTLYFLRDSGLWQLLFSWDDAWSSEPREALPDPVWAVLTAQEGEANMGWLALLAEGEQERDVWLWGREPSGALAELARLPGLVPYEVEMSLSESLGTLALAWGVTFGAGEVGPHLSIVDADTGEIALAPQLIDHPINHSSSSSSIWAAAAPHPEGHAVVWGGWRETTYNGIYGKIIRLR